MVEDASKRESTTSKTEKKALQSRCREKKIKYLRLTDMKFKTNGGQLVDFKKGCQGSAGAFITPHCRRKPSQSPPDQRLSSMAAPSQSSPNQASEKASAEDVKPASEAPARAKVESETGNPAEETSADVEDQAQAVALKPAPPVASQDLTYEAAEESDAFLLAKRLMADGDFDSAMETIGTAMGSIISVLGDDDAAVHPALAPLYYLYGTTLLYSIEESSDNLEPALDTEEDEADDSQIAWENLETARLIVVKLVASDPSNKKLVLDLAQIHMRLGDLQRYNGRYLEAVQDYLQCLELRQPVLGPYDRKLASTHYNLGLVYMLLVSETNNPEGDGAVGTAALSQEYRNKALTHYLAGGKAFAGQIAFLCGVSPEEITADAAPTEVKGKTTGMDEAELSATAMSATLSAIRARVAKLSGPQDEIEEFKELLDEIQETMDEAESTQKAVAEVKEIKAQAQAAAEGDGEVVHVDGSTTSIGFGTNPVAAAETGSPSFPSVGVAAAPMMVVRKKKKRDDKDDSKMSADGDENAAMKRQKVE
jgi:tetratricopeptide (TPR) repeat protein